MSEVTNIKELNERIERESVFRRYAEPGDEQGDLSARNTWLTRCRSACCRTATSCWKASRLAKTLAITTLAQAVNAHFSRIQFTPRPVAGRPDRYADIQPEDRRVFGEKRADLANFILADEINRPSAKVQSALLEAMQERQVTIGDTTYKLPEPVLS